MQRGYELVIKMLEKHDLAVDGVQRDSFLALDVDELGLFGDNVIHGSI